MFIINFAKRLLKSIKRRFLSFFVAPFTGAQEFIIAKETRPDFLIIGPGESPIPPTGWGAVEILISDQISSLKKLGFSVDLLNSRNLIHWVRAFARKPKYIINHYDLFALRAYVFSKITRKKYISVTHYAYAEQPQRWDRAYLKLARWVSKANGLVALNPRIKTVYSELNPKQHIEVIPNGVNINKISFDKRGSGAICLGKVEIRKKQIEIAQHISDTTTLDFAGPIVDHRFNELNEFQKTRFVGPWSREDVENLLTNYSVLVLASDAEADALVLYEAQAAGLSIIASSKAIGAQNKELPWIRVIELDDFSALSQAVAEVGAANTKLREQIRNHALANYSIEQSTKKLAEFAILICSV